jgi:CrcB protein
MSYFLVFIGGGLGSIVRFLFSKFFTGYSPVFPFATFCANAVSCLILGSLFGYFASKQMANENARVLVAVGFCGGFSTFSAFSYETFLLVSAGNLRMAALNIFANLLVCYLAVMAGFFAFRGLQ